jgi:hypothetical protein
MLTRSESLLREAVALRATVDELQEEIEDREAQLRAASLSLEEALTAHRFARQEERQERRTYVPPSHQLGVRQPWGEPMARWRSWKRTLNLVIRLPSYKYPSYGRDVPKWQLTKKLVAFAAAMMAVENTAAWNPRNPNPHLP